MEYSELIKHRCSIRKYNGKAVEDNKLQQILEAGRIAPTAANKQPQKIVVIQKKENLERLQKYTNLHGAPIALLICADHKKSWIRSYDGKDMVDIDTSIIGTHMMLEACNQGLGSVWICSFDEKGIRQEFTIPKTLELVTILCIGYADGEGTSPERFTTQRKVLAEIVGYEEF